MPRPYDEVFRALSAARTPRTPWGGRDERMRAVADALWGELRSAGVSWVGFYVHDPDNTLKLGATPDAPLVLGPHRDKPACSPIGPEGACGQAFLSRQTLIVRDVADLGESYIACDPRDRSEIVVPLLEGERCWGVLDLDSWSVGDFDETDAEGLTGLLASAGFTPATGYRITMPPP